MARETTERKGMAAVEEHEDERPRLTRTVQRTARVNAQVFGIRIARKVHAAINDAVNKLVQARPDIDAEAVREVYVSEVINTLRHVPVSDLGEES